MCCAAPQACACRPPALRLLCSDIKEQKDEELLVLPTDAALFEDEGFK